MSSQDIEALVSLYHNINLYCAIGALVFLALAIFIFIKFKIPRVFGEWTGRTAKKAIGQMMDDSGSSGELASSKIGEDGRKRRKGKTGTLTSTGRLRQNTGKITTGQTAETGPVASESSVAASKETPKTTYEFSYTQQIDSNDNFGSEETNVLSNFGNEETNVLNNLSNEETNVLNNLENEETGVLKQMQYAEDETAGLSGVYNAPVYQASTSGTMVLDQSMLTDKRDFVIERSIVEIHTDEVI